MAVTGRIRRNTRVGRYCAGKVWGVGTGDVGGYALRFGESGLCSTQWTGKVNVEKVFCCCCWTHILVLSYTPEIRSDQTRTGQAYSFTKKEDPTVYIGGCLSVVG